MFGIWDPSKRASLNFYRNVFAAAAFAAFAAALATNHPFAYGMVLIFGALSRTAIKKDWKNPAFSYRFPWLARSPKYEEAEPPHSENGSQ
ncbi:MAG: hypothetical protein LBU13_05520 [Synergistaceae bacterium]|jgi:hypothetical protein|nr:hypothetical protein [Synergistaceae bacterium]